MKEFVLTVCIRKLVDVDVRPGACEVPEPGEGNIECIELIVPVTFRIRVYGDKYLYQSVVGSDPLMEFIRYAIIGLQRTLLDEYIIRQIVFFERP